MLFQVDHLGEVASLGRRPPLPRMPYPHQNGVGRPPNPTIPLAWLLRCIPRGPWGPWRQPLWAIYGPFNQPIVLLTFRLPTHLLHFLIKSRVLNSPYKVSRKKFDKTLNISITSEHFRQSLPALKSFGIIPCFSETISIT
jgi:hypothetical protein